LSVSFSVISSNSCALFAGKNEAAVEAISKIVGEEQQHPQT
jgi:hypothetical protein